jgi:hypothetical protein
MRVHAVTERVADSIGRLTWKAAVEH